MLETFYFLSIVLFILTFVGSLIDMSLYIKETKQQSGRLNTIKARGIELHLQNAELRIANKELKNKNGLLVSKLRKQRKIK